MRHDTMPLAAALVTLSAWRRHRSARPKFLRQMSVKRSTRQRGKAGKPLLGNAVAAAGEPGPSPGEVKSRHGRTGQRD